MGEVSGNKFYATQLKNLSQDSYAKVKDVLESDHEFSWLGGSQHKFLGFKDGKLFIREKNIFDRICTSLGISSGIISRDAIKQLRTEQIGEQSNPLGEQSNPQSIQNREWIVVDKKLIEKMGDGRKASGIFGALFSYKQPLKEKGFYRTIEDYEPVQGHQSIIEALKAEHIDAVSAVKRGMITVSEAISKSFMTPVKAEQIGHTHEHLAINSEGNYQVKGLPAGVEVTLKSLNAESDALKRAGISDASPQKPASSPRAQLGIGVGDILQERIGNEYVRFESKEVEKAFAEALGFGTNENARALLEKAIVMGQERGIRPLHILKAIANEYKKEGGTPQEELERLQNSTVAALVKTDILRLEEAMGKGFTYIPGFSTPTQVRLTAQEATERGFLEALPEEHYDGWRKLDKILGKISYTLSSKNKKTELKLEEKLYGCSSEKASTCF